MVKFPSRIVRDFLKRQSRKTKECRTCKRKFHDELKLIEHMSVHAGSFFCDICGEEFRCYGALKGHIRLHTGDRPYHCKGCLKSRLNSKCSHKSKSTKRIKV